LTDLIENRQLIPGHMELGSVNPGCHPTRTHPCTSKSQQWTILTAMRAQAMATVVWAVGMLFFGSFLDFINQLNDFLLSLGSKLLLTQGPTLRNPRHATHAHPCPSTTA
jgi:hypothetical protein